MLPDRSKRHAGIDGEVERLQLASHWQLLLVALLMLGLFRVIFPDKALVAKLYDHQQLDALTMSYIENLRRTDPDNADLTILLGRVQRDQWDIVNLDHLWQPVIQTGNPRQRFEAQALLLAAYDRLLRTEMADTERQHQERAVTVLLEGANRDGIPPELAANCAAMAFKLEHIALGTAFLNRVAPTQTAVALANYGAQALAQGRYTLASEYYLLARQHTNTLDAARGYFRQGIATLMAASRFEQAMAAAERDIGDLADDPQTLRYLAQAALAAGYPARAARYAQWLVFQRAPAAAGGAH
jgi:hypothetical protein